MVPSLLVVTAAIVTGFFIGKFTLKSEAYRVLFLCFLLTRKAKTEAETPILWPPDAKN